MLLFMPILAGLSFGASAFLHHNTHGFASHRRRVIMLSLKLAGVALVVFWLYVVLAMLGS
jgi:hypothetical protein